MKTFNSIKPKVAAFKPASIGVSVGGGLLMAALAFYSADTGKNPTRLLSAEAAPQRASQLTAYSDAYSAQNLQAAADAADAARAAGRFTADSRPSAANDGSGMGAASSAMPSSSRAARGSVATDDWQKDLQAYQTAQAAAMGGQGLSVLEQGAPSPAPAGAAANEAQGAPQQRGEGQLRQGRGVAQVSGGSSSTGGASAGASLNSNYGSFADARISDSQLQADARRAAGPQGNFSMGRAGAIGGVGISGGSGGAGNGAGQMGAGLAGDLQARAGRGIQAAGASSLEESKTLSDSVYDDGEAQGNATAVTAESGPRAASQSLERFASSIDQGGGVGRALSKFDRVSWEIDEQTRLRGKIALKMIGLIAAGVAAIFLTRKLPKPWSFIAMGAGLLGMAAFMFVGKESIVDCINQLKNFKEIRGAEGDLDITMPAAYGLMSAAVILSATPAWDKVTAWVQKAWDKLGKLGRKLVGGLGATANPTGFAQEALNSGSAEDNPKSAHKTTQPPNQ